jgi:hypothetical protein
MRRLLIPVMLALVSACAGEATVAYSTPNASVRLVEVNPGVYTVADYGEPVFFADNYYWRYYDGRWFRSSWYTGGWVTASPPVAVLRIDRPYRYVHYRPESRDRVVIRDSRGRWYRR